MVAAGTASSHRLVIDHPNLAKPHYKSGWKNETTPVQKNGTGRRKETGWDREGLPKILWPHNASSCKKLGWSFCFLTEPVPSTNFHNGSKQQCHTRYCSCAFSNWFLYSASKPVEINSHSFYTYQTSITSDEVWRDSLTCIGFDVGRVCRLDTNFHGHYNGQANLWPSFAESCQTVPIPRCPCATSYHFSAVVFILLAIFIMWSHLRQSITMESRRACRYRFLALAKNCF